jgi:carbamate kinase
MPLDVCGAENQGMIGYLLQQAMDEELSVRRLDIDVVTILTQTLVDRMTLRLGTPRSR